MQLRSSAALQVAAGSSALTFKTRAKTELNKSSTTNTTKKVTIKDSKKDHHKISSSLKKPTDQHVINTLPTPPPPRRFRVAKARQADISVVEHAYLLRSRSSNSSDLLVQHITTTSTLDESGSINTTQDPCTNNQTDLQSEKEKASPTPASTDPQLNQTSEAESLTREETQIPDLSDSATLVGSQHKPAPCTPNNHQCTSPQNANSMLASPSHTPQLSSPTIVISPIDDPLVTPTRPPRQSPDSFAAVLRTPLRANLKPTRSRPLFNLPLFNADGTNNRRAIFEYMQLLDSMDDQVFMHPPSSPSPIVAVPKPQVLQQQPPIPVVVKKRVPLQVLKQL